MCLLKVLNSYHLESLRGDTIALLTSLKKVKEFNAALWQMLMRLHLYAAV